MNFLFVNICIYHNTNANTAPMRISPKAVAALAGVAGVAAVAAASA